MADEEKASAWDLETGLPNDFDGWVKTAKFGYKEEYAQAVQQRGGEGVMLILDLDDEGGEAVASPGYSIGTGWIVSEDGKTISHPKRQNVVRGSMYGNLQTRVRKDLGVDMDSRGVPTDARCWEGLGFHWMQEEHAVVSRGEAGAPTKATGLMPVEVLGAQKPTVKVEAPASDIEKELIGMVGKMGLKEFQVAAIRKPDVVGDDKLVASILDDGPTGFYATHK